MNYYEALAPIIKEAGKIMLGAHDIEDNDNVHIKPGDANFVTEYDVAVQNYLIKEISKVYPDATFLAEEKDNDEACVDADRCFIIDPIDGTTNFIHDKHCSAISVAVVSHGVGVFGCVYDPYLDEFYHAEKGKGAFVNDRPVRVSDRDFSVAITVFGTCPYYKEELSDATFGLAKELFMNTADIRRSGSAALDIAGVAAGRNDLFFEIILAPWDFAAAAVMVEEAGGVITDMTGAPLVPGRSSGIIAGSRENHKKLLEIAKKYI